MSPNRMSRTARIVALATLALAAACVPPPEPQPNRWGAPAPSASTAAAAPAGATCGETLACYSGCGTTDACIQSCDGRAAPETTAASHEALSCLAQSGCADSTCAAQRCAAQLSACTGGEATTGSTATTATAPSAGMPALADLAGEWGADGAALKNYYSSSTGAYTGYHAVQTSETWVIDANGNVSSTFAGSSTGGSRTIVLHDSRPGTMTLAADGTVVIHWDGAATQMFLLRRFDVHPDATIMTLNGPYYDDGIPDRARTDSTYAGNLDTYWVRAAR